MGFNKQDDIFIATPEKAFLDAMYLQTYGKYHLDFEAIDLSKLNKAKIKAQLPGYPNKLVNVVKRLCEI